MLVIPAIDIRKGRCAQLVGGRVGSERYYGNPIEVARRWVSEGAKLLHVIDLDAALGLGDNSEMLSSLRNAVDVELQVGGGIRSLQKIKFLLNLGFERIILGTLLFSDRERGYPVLKEVVNTYGKNRIIAAIDSRGEFITTHGWRKTSPLRTIDLIKEVEDLVWGFLYTDVEVEGQMRGVRIENIRKVITATKRPIIVAGGVGSYDDLKKVEKAGAWGVVLGKALYEGKITLRQER